MTALFLTAAVLTCHQCTEERRRKYVGLDCQFDGHLECEDLQHSGGLSDIEPFAQAFCRNCLNSMTIELLAKRHTILTQLCLQVWSGLVKCKAIYLSLANELAHEDLRKKVWSEK